MTPASTPSRSDVDRRIIALVRDRLPTAWVVTAASDHQAAGLVTGPTIAVEAPDGRLARLVVETKQVVERRDVAHLGAQSRRARTAPADVPVVAARYLSPSVRAALSEEGLSYADATGNLRIAVDSPAIFISDRGEDRDPWREGRPRGTLKGEPAARVARTLLDHRRDWRVRDLIETSGASSGATYRVLDYLQREDLIAKEEKRYKVTDWERLLRGWSADAAFQETTRTMACIDPRGVDNFLKKISPEPPFPVAVTGSVAAREWAPYAPAKAAYVYVSSIQEAAEQWGLRANAAAPNVILLEPRTIGDTPFLNVATSNAGYPVAAPAQVAADLLNGPGREPAEGNHLIEWLKANELQWRRA